MKLWIFKYQNKRSFIDCVVKMAAHTTSASLFMNGRHVVIISISLEEREAVCYFKTYTNR